MAIIKRLLPLFLIAALAAVPRAQVVGPVSVQGAPTPAALPSGVPDFNLSPDGMDQTVDAAMSKLDASLAGIVSLKPEDRTFANTVGALDAAYADFNEAVTPLTFMKDVSPRADLRDKGDALNTKVSQLFIQLASREDIYRAVKEYAAKQESLDGPRQKLLNAMLRDFKRNGMELTPEKRARLLDIQKKLVDLQNGFSNNLKSEKQKLEVLREQLEGAPDDFVKNLEASPNGADRALVTLDYPTYETFMHTVKNPALRQQLEFVFNNQAAEKNVPILQEALGLRQELAQLLGYPTYAHYATDGRMAKAPEPVLAFLNRLKDLVAGKAVSEQKELLDLKRKDLPKAERLYNWDLPGEIGAQLGYYIEQQKKAHFDLDPEEVRQYFPVDRVVEQTMALYQELFGVQFKELPTTHQVEGANVWHPEVRLFEVRDSATGQRLAHFYLDLYPRDNKYGHMAEFRLIGGRRLADGGYREPVAAMVGNFTKPTADKPGLLSFGEVETFFHEFGHVMHETLTRAEFAGQSGTNTALDFVEAPSQMLENFVRQPEVLNRLSGHYQDPGKKLPRELLEKIVSAESVGKAIGVLRIVALSVLDMTYHTAVPVDTTALMEKIFVETGYLAPTPGTHFQARFGHIMGGYEAGYYGYMWSRVFAQDIFSRFEKEGILSPAVGGDYRRFILEKGGSEDEEQLLIQFLGRKPDEAAFLRSLGVTPSGT
jgi:thimet oligopeptidase